MPLDRRNIEFHRTDGAFDFPSACRHRSAQRVRGIFDAKGHGTGAGPMLARELLRQAIRFGIDDEIDIALPVQRNRLRTVASNAAETHGFEQTAEVCRIRGRVLHELEPVGTQRVLPQGLPLRSLCCGQLRFGCCHVSLP